MDNIKHSKKLFTVYWPALWAVGEDVFKIVDNKCGVVPHIHHWYHHIQPHCKIGTKYHSQEVHTTSEYNTS